MARRFWVLLLAFQLFSCAEDQKENAAGPVVTEASAKAVTIGQTVEFYGKNLLAEKQGKSRLVFEGTFQDLYGNVRDVSLSAPTFYGGREVGENGRDILTWSRFGPFNNPFTKDKSLGLFKGTVRVENEHKDGTIDIGEPSEFALEVGPSVIINKLEPLEADCGSPALRILPGIPYKMSVSVSGIKPTSFVYEFNKINGKDDITRFVHTLNPGQPAEDDAVGEFTEIIVFNHIPEDQQSYVTGIRVQAYDDAGRYVETALPIGVHRPIEVSYDGTYELAERYEPVPVSSCTKGGLDTTVSYSESTSETKVKSVSVTVNSNWSSSAGKSVSQNTSEGISIGESTSRSIENSLTESESLSNSYGLTYNQSQSNSVDFSSTTGENWSWNMSQGESQESYQERMNSRFSNTDTNVEVGISGEVSVAKVVDVGGHVEQANGVSRGTSSGSTTGVRERSSTNRGYSMSGSSSQTQSYGSTVANSQTQSISGTYVQGRSNTTSSGSGVEMSQEKTWELSKGLSSDEVISTGNAQAITEAVVTSSTSSVFTSLSGFIPRNQTGIFYRQTTRWVRKAEVLSYDLCGVASHMGEVQFNEWDWAAELAVGQTCPPPSEMPKAKCFIDPCVE